MDISQINPSWFIAVGSISSAAIGAVSIHLAWQSHKDVVDQKRPRIRVTVMTSPSSSMALMLMIENLGKETARDIVFKASRRIPSGVHENKRKGTTDVTNITKGPLVEGLPALAAGDKRLIRWGWQGELHKAFELANIRTIDITANFTDGAGAKHCDDSVIEIQSYMNSASDTLDPLVQISNRLQKASQDLNRSFRQVSQDVAKISQELKAINSKIRR